MQVTFYKIHDDVRCLNKDVEHTAIGPAFTDITIKPTEAVSILSPELIMAYDQAYINANYCYIDIFKRYYFCTVALAPGSRAIVSCKVDPLMSFKTGLLNIPVTVVRSQTAGINYVPDSQLPIDPARFVLDVKDFPGHDFPLVTERQYAVQINASYSS